MSGPEPATGAGKLARAVILFHRGSPWTAWDRGVWLELTGSEDATTRSLCDLARRVLAEEARAPAGRRAGTMRLAAARVKQALIGAVWPSRR